MTDELYNFANAQNNKNYDKFINAGFCHSEFIEASVCMVLKSLMAAEAISHGIANPTEEQVREFTLLACDDLIEWCNAYKENIMNKED